MHLYKTCYVDIIKISIIVHNLNNITYIGFQQEILYIHVYI